MSTEPALSLVPLARAPPNRCWPQLYVVGGRVGQGAQLCLSAVRLNDLDWVATAQPVLVADSHGELDLVRGDLLQPGLELGPFGATWRMIQDPVR